MVSSDTTEVDRCALCGSDDRRTVFTEPPHSVMRCNACGLVWVTPRYTAEALRRVYDEGYWSSESPKTRGYADYRRDEPLYLKTFRKRFEFVGRHLPAPGRILDVGTAAGYFLTVAADAGWDVYGVELSAEIAERAVERFGPERIHVGTLDTAPFPDGSFDVVSMWDLVEHVPDPMALLERARQLLKPGGTLIVETQNVDSPFARLLKQRWHHFKHDEHLYHFNPDTIRRLLTGSGFGVVALTSRRAGKYVSLDFIAERSSRLHPVVGKMLSPLGRLDGANVYINLHDEMIVVGKAG